MVGRREIQRLYDAPGVNGRTSRAGGERRGGQAGREPDRFSGSVSVRSFFPQLRVFNNFSASFSGSFSAIHVAFPFVFSNFSGSFLKRGILFCFFHPKIR